MRTYQRTLVTLDTGLLLPFRNHNGYAALFKTGGTGLKCTVLTAVKHADRQLVTALCVHGINDVGNKCRAVAGAGFFILGILPGSRNIDLYQSIDRAVYGSAVHVHNLIALFAIGLFDCLFDKGDCLVKGNDLGQFKEGALGYHVDTVRAKSYLNGNIHRVNGIEMNLIFRQITLYVAGQLLLQLFRRPYAVEQEGSALLQTL